MHNRYPAWSVNALTASRLLVKTCLISLAIALPAQAHFPIPLRGQDAVVQSVLERYPYIVENPGQGTVVYVLAPVNDPWGKRLHELWPQAKTEGLEVRWINIVGDKPATPSELNFIAENNLNRDLGFMKNWFANPGTLPAKSTPPSAQGLQPLKTLDQTLQPRALKHGSIYHSPALLWMDGKDLVYYSSANFPETVAELQLVLDDIRFNQGGWREFTNNPIHHHHH